LTVQEEILAEVVREGEVAFRLLGLTSSEVGRLQSLAPSILEREEEIVSSTLEAIKKLPETSSILQDENAELGLRMVLESLLTFLFMGDYGREHAETAFRAGLAFIQLGLSEGVLVGSVGHLVGEASRFLDSPTDVPALVKAAYWNLAVVLHAYQHLRMFIIREAAGISGKVLDRLVKLYTAQVLEKMGVKIHS